MSLPPEAHPPGWLAIWLSIMLWALIIWGIVAVANADTYLNLGGVSYHSVPHRFNGNNPGLGIEQQLTPTDRVTAGGYYNSLYHMSYYVGYGRSIDLSPAWRVGILTGYVSGYDESNLKRYQPYAIPFAEWSGERFGMNFTVLPETNTNPVMVVAMQIKVRLK